MSAHSTTRGDDTLNLRVLRFRGTADREEPVMLALDLCARGRFQDAIDVVEAALVHAPDDAELLLPLGRAYYEDGQHDRAQALLVAAAQADPTWPEPYAWLTRVLDARGRTDKADEVAVRAVELGADDSDVRSRANTFLRDRALTTRLARWRDNAHCEDATLLAIGLLDASRASDARVVIETALADDPHDEDLRAIAMRAGLEVVAIAEEVAIPDEPSAAEPVVELTFAHETNAIEQLLMDTLADSAEPSIIVEPELFIDAAAIIAAHAAEASVAQPEPVVETQPEPVVETQPEPTIETHAAPQPVIETRPEPVIETQPAPAPVIHAQPEPAPVIHAQPAPALEPVAPKPAPFIQTKPAPLEPAKPLVVIETRPEPKKHDTLVDVPAPRRPVGPTHLGPSGVTPRAPRRDLFNELLHSRLGARRATPRREQR